MDTDRPENTDYEIRGHPPVGILYIRHAPDKPKTKFSNGTKKGQIDQDLLSEKVEELTSHEGLGAILVDFEKDLLLNSDSLGKLFPLAVYAQAHSTPYQTVPVVLCGVPDKVQNVLKITKTQRFYEFRHNLDAALEEYAFR